MKNSNIRATIQRARDAIENGNLQIAVQILEKAILRNSENPKLLFELGYVLYESGDAVRSREVLLKLIAVSPEYNCRAQFTLSELSEPSESVRWVENGISLGAAQLAALESRAATPNDGEKFAERLADLRRTLAQGWCKRAELAFLAGGASPAVFEALNAAVGLDAAGLEAYHRLLLLYADAGDAAAFVAVGQAMVARARELETREDERLMEFGTEFFGDVSALFIEAEQWALAVDWARVSVAVNPADRLSLYHIAFASYRRGDTAAAAAALEELEELGVDEAENAELAEAFRELRDKVSPISEMENE